MGDMIDAFRDMKSYEREKRQTRFAEVAPLFDPTVFAKHTPFHWFATVQGKRLDYWPSTAKWSFGGKIYRGNHQNVMEFIAKRTTP